MDKNTADFYRRSEDFTEEEVDAIKARIDEYKDLHKEAREEHYKQLEKDWPKIKAEIDELLKNTPRKPKTHKTQKPIKRRG